MLPYKKLIQEKLQAKINLDELTKSFIVSLNAVIEELENNKGITFLVTKIIILEAKLFLVEKLITTIYDINFNNYRKQILTFDEESLEKEPDLCL